MRNYAGSALMLMVTIAAAVGSYTINLKVSGERAAVDRLRRTLVADARDMRTLQAELRTRARLPEMQRWNDQVLQMSAPAAGQYMGSPVQLASFGAAPPAAIDAPVVRYAVANPAPAVAAPIIRAAYPAAPRNASRQAVAVPVAAPATARIIRAGYAARTGSSSPSGVTSMAADIGASLDAAIRAPRDLMPVEGQ